MRNTLITSVCLSLMVLCSDDCLPISYTEVSSQVLHSDFQSMWRDDSDYHFKTTGLSAVAGNPAQGVIGSVSAHKLTVDSDDGRLSILFKAYGRSPDIKPIVAGTPCVLSANRIEFDLDNLKHWYVNSPLGVEQGWTLSNPPPGNLEAPVTIVLGFQGDFTARLVSGQSISLETTEGRQTLTYGELAAWDANGSEFPVCFRQDGDCFLVEVQDEGAVYPLTIDPWVKRAELLPAGDHLSLDGFGQFIEISDDSGTIVVGSENEDLTATGSNRGAVYVFTPSGEDWTGGADRVKLTASDGTDLDYLGNSVAVNANGSTIFACAYRDGDSQEGSAYVFERPPGGWVNGTETNKMIAEDPVGNARFGKSVALSPDGSLAVFGAPGQGDNGAIYVYERNGDTWGNVPFFRAKLESGVIDGGILGYSVDVSSNGTIIIAGARDWPSTPPANRGCVYVFVKPGGGWTNSTATAMLTASDAGSDPDLFLGSDVKISDDGALIAAGAYEAKVSGSNVGAVYVFTNSTGPWSNGTESAKLYAAQGGAGDEFGWRLDMASQGGHIVAGAKFNDDRGEDCGAVYFFERPPGGWENGTETQKLTPVSIPASYFGYDTAIGDDPGYIVPGLPSNDDICENCGMAAVYVPASVSGAMQFILLLNSN